MRKNKLVKMMTLIMILAISTMVLAACSNNTQNPDSNISGQDSNNETQQVETIAKAREEVINAITNSFDFEANKPVGFDYSFIIPGEKEYTIAFKGYIDKKNVANSKMFLGVNEGNKLLVNVSADDEYLFVETSDAKKRITGFELANTLSTIKLPTSKDLKDFVGGMPMFIINTIFTDEFAKTVDNEVTHTTLKGNLNEIGLILSKVGANVSIELGNQLGALLKDVTLTLDTKIVNNKVESLKLVANINGNPLEVKVNTKVANYEPVMYVPTKDATGYDEIKALNFNLKGSVNLLKEVPYNTKTVGTYEYEFAVDFDLFKFLRNTIVKNNADEIVFDTTNMFKGQENSKIYFDVRHTCKNDCACNMYAKGNGSILTIAYDPINFNSNDLFLSVNTKAFIPKNIADALGVGDLASTIEQVLGFLPNGYLSSNINPQGIVRFVETLLSKDTANATADGDATFDITKVNILDIVANVYDLLAGIRGIGNGVIIPTDEIYDAVNSVTPALNMPINISALLKTFTQNVEKVSFVADVAEYGNADIADVNYYNKFMTNKTYDESGNVMYLPKYTDRYVETDYAGIIQTNVGPVVKTEVVLDRDGYPVIFPQKTLKAGSEDMLYGIDADGKYYRKPISSKMYEYLFSDKYQLEVQFTTVTGAKYTSKVTVAADTINRNDFSKDQKVTFRTYPADGYNANSLSVLFTQLGDIVSNIINSTGINLDLSLLGMNVDTVLPAAEEPKAYVEFYDDGAKLAFNPENSYEMLADKVNLRGNIIFEFANNGEPIKYTFAKQSPANSSNYWDSSKGFIKRNTGFDFEFVKLGYTFKYAVNVKPSTNITATDVNGGTVKAGKTIDVKTRVTFKHTNSNSITFYSNSNFFKGDFSVVIPQDIDPAVKANINLVPTYDNKNIINGYKVTFAKEGDYVLYGTYDGITFKYNYKVTPADVVVEKYQNDYFITETYTGNGETYIEFGRPVDKPLQSHSKMAVNVKKGMDSLVFGVDYTLFFNDVKLDKNEFELKEIPYPMDSLRVVYSSAINTKEDELSVEIMAVDYNNQVIMTATKYNQSLVPTAVLNDRTITITFNGSASSDIEVQLVTVNPITGKEVGIFDSNKPIIVDGISLKDSSEKFDIKQQPNGQTIIFTIDEKRYGAYKGKSIVARFNATDKNDNIIVIDVTINIPA